MTGHGRERYVCISGASLHTIFCDFRKLNDLLAPTVNKFPEHGHPSAAIPLLQLTVARVG